MHGYFLFTPLRVSENSDEEPVELSYSDSRSFGNNNELISAFVYPLV